MTTFFVYGEPRPQGSKTPLPTKGGKVVMVEGGNDLARERNRNWRQDVAHAARLAHGNQPPMDGPLRVTLRFVFPRPKSAKRDARWKDTRPDIDKLERAVLDALKVGGVIVDDARVAQVSKSKELADRDGREPVGVTVAVVSAVG